MTSMREPHVFKRYLCLHSLCWNEIPRRVQLHTLTRAGRNRALSMVPRQQQEKKEKTGKIKLTRIL